MPTIHDDEDDEGDGLDDSEYPDESDQDEENEVSDPCPNCGRQIYFDADICPHCGEHIIPTAGKESNVKWVAIVLLAAMAVVALAYLRILW